jgi:hypothetical protein
MSFSWAETITQFQTPLKATHVNELRTNINHTRAHMALAGYSWTSTITQYISIELEQHITELKTALDQAHSANYCSTYYVTHYSGYQSTYYSGNLTANNGAG